MPTTRVFAVATADYGNIGDALIYRRALAWIADVPSRHYFVGRAPEEWLDQLRLRRHGDTVYGARAGQVQGRFRALLTWSLRLVFGRGRPALVFDTGETPLTLKKLPMELIWLILSALVRLRGGVVVRPPNAIRVNPSRVTLAVYRVSARLANFLFLRNQASRDLAGAGEVVPDIGFSEPPRGGLDESQRKALVISLRGHNPLPGDEWFEGVAAFAVEQNLDIVTMTQVSHDEQRSIEIAERLSATNMPFRPENKLEMERELIELYERSAMVLSDRMHVLVYASSCGAVPAECIANPSQKIRSHFAIAGVDGLSKDAEGLSADEVTGFLRAQLGRAAEIREKVSGAAKVLQDAEGRVRSAFAKA